MWPVWLMVLLTLALVATATLGLSDAASRAFLAGALRHRTYTQIYKTVVRRTHERLWDALCDPLDKAASLPATFRAALTWRLYDRALLIAVLYPILLPVLWWMASGQAAQLGPVVFLEATGLWTVWPERAAVLGAFVILIAGFVGEKLALASPQRFWRSVAGWLPIFAFAFALAGALAGALAVAAAAAAALAYLDGRSNQRLARWLVTLFAVSVWIVAALLVPWDAASDTQRLVFVFLGVFPLLNALFDVLSYAVTLALIRRGLNAPLPLLYGIADLLIALLLFLGLGATLVAAIAVLNGIAGTDILDVTALLRDVERDPHAYWWLYAMVFSTILPTALHGLLALLGVQGIWPRAWRRPVAGWVDSADRTQLQNLRASLALGLLWAAPVWLLVGIGWALWQMGGDAALRFAELYLHALNRIAAQVAGTV